MLMDISVEVQAWGQLEASGCAHGWFRVTRLKNPKSLDISYLKPLAKEIIERNRHVISAPMARLIFRKEGKKYMTLDLYDL